MVATFTMAVGSREGEATLVLPFSSFAQALNNAASPQLSDTALAKRKRAAEALTARLNLVPGRRQRAVRAAHGLLGRPALPRRR